MPSIHFARPCPACLANNSTERATCHLCEADIRNVDPIAVKQPPRVRTVGKPLAYGLSLGRIELGILGLIAGGGLALLFRPSAPFVGQLPVEVVLTRGAELHGLNQLLVSIAERSFNVMVLGALLGVAAGILTSDLLRSGTLQSALAGRARRRCPYCAEMIQPQARICRYCDRRV